MARIDSQTSLARHPKTLRLARRLSISVPAAVGHLHLLWGWALEYAQDGNVGHFEAADLAVACLWEGDESALLPALQHAGFVDMDGGIHDWREYTGRLIESRRKNVERAKAWREQHGTRTVPSIDSAANAHVAHNERITNAHVTPTETRTYTYDAIEAPACEGGPTRAGSLAPPLPPPHPTQEDALSTNVESGVAIRPAPKPAKEKAPVHPALKVARDVLGVRADETQRRAIIETIGDDDHALTLFAACCTQWTMRGYNRRNLAGVLEWVAEGGPPPRERSPNGAAQRNGALSTSKPPSQFSRNLQTIEHFWSEHAPDRDRTENDLRAVHRELPGELSG
jgi:hypothetical protein